MSGASSMDVSRFDPSSVKSCGGTYGSGVGEFERSLYSEPFPARRFGDSTGIDDAGETSSSCGAACEVDLLFLVPKWAAAERSCEEMSSPNNKSLKWSSRDALGSESVRTGRFEIGRFASGTVVASTSGAFSG